MEHGNDAFEKVAEYVGSEMSASVKDYEFITQLNKTATESFKDLQQVAEKVAKNLTKINENQVARQRLDNLVKTIDNIDSKVTSLEALAYKIDSYSKRLEDSFKKLESDFNER